MNIPNSRRLWQKYPTLVGIVKTDYLAQKAFGRGHNILHSVMVAQYAELIAETERVGELAWIAGIVHEPHRLFPGITREEIERKLREYLARGLPAGALTEAETSAVVEAVREHSKRNDPNDNSVTVTLKDADRLTSIGPYHWLNAAQFRSTIPAVDPRFIMTSDPRATFKNPFSVLQDLKYTLEWESWLRLPKAKELGKPKFDAIRWYIGELEKQFEILGLLPFPDVLVVEQPTV